jgi:hypothetical protein
MHAAMHVVGVIHGQILDAKAPIPRPDEEGYSEERQAEFFRQAALEMQRDLGAGSYRAPADRLPTSVEKEPGRNDHVTIMNPSTGEEETLKYKHALSKLNSGWMLVSV